MKSLETVQKTFGIVKIFIKIAKVLTIIGAVVCGIGALSVLAIYTGGRVFSIFGNPIHLFENIDNLPMRLAEMLTELLVLITNAILLSFAYNYLKIEQREGTPFTEFGAEKLKKLGIRCIYMPIVATAISTGIVYALGVEIAFDVSDMPGIFTGVVLILVSFIFRYGAELEEKIGRDKLQW